MSEQPQKPKRGLVPKIKPNVTGGDDTPPDRPGVGLNLKDGWLFGIGFGLAMVIVVLLATVVLGCVAIIAVVGVGSEIGALL